MNNKFCCTAASSLDSMIDLEQQIVATSDLTAYRENQYGLPSRSDFVSFIAKRLRENLSIQPTAMQISVAPAADHVFRIGGSVTVESRVTPLQGEIHWLPRLNCFRGHMIVDPEGRLNKQLAEDADAVRPVDWHRTEWTDDDHTHCILCMAANSSFPSDADFNFGFTADNAGWLCPTCYNDVVVNGGEHPWIKSQ